MNLRDSVLNAIAMGIETKVDLSTFLGVHYSSIYRVITELKIDKKLIIFNEIDQEVYGLAIDERWRLYSFKYTPLVIYCDEIKPFADDDLKVAFRLQDFMIYHLPTSYVKIFKIGFYIQDHVSLDIIWSQIENKYDFRRLLPFLTIYDENKIPLRLISTIQTFYYRKLGILWNSLLRDTWILFNEPIQCVLERDDADMLEKIYSNICVDINTARDLAEKLGIGTETVKKYTRILEKRGKIVKKENYWQKVDVTCDNANEYE